MPSVTVKNETKTRLLISVFNKGDSGVPFSTGWVEAGQSSALDTGKFDEISLGMQVQDGGRWIGDDPKNPPYFKPNTTVTAICRLQ